MRRWSQFTNVFTLELQAALAKEFGHADVFVWGDPPKGIPVMVRCRIYSDKFSGKTSQERQDMVMKVANRPDLEPANDILFMAFTFAPGEESVFDRVRFEEPWADPVKRLMEIRRRKA